MSQTLSPESEAQRIRNWEKLSKIFNPHTIEKRLKHYNYPKDGENPTACFAHYTSAEAGLQIIKSQRLWMRNPLCMADYKEIQHGFENFQTFFASKTNEKQFLASLDKCFPGVGQEAFNIFNAWWNDIRVNTYVTSLSEHKADEDMHGRLSMWRGFGSGDRVALIFKPKWHSETGKDLHLTVSPVTYLPRPKVHEMLSKVISNVECECEFLQSLDKQLVLGYIAHTLMTEVVCHKHEGFHEEIEWRAIYSPSRWPSKLIEPDTQVISGVPQVIFKIPLTDEFCLDHLLDRVIIGPTQYAIPISQAFVKELDKIGVTDPMKRVIVSGIPLRT